MNYFIGKLFVREMGQMTLAAGSVALIPCLYGGYPVDKIVWRQNGSEIDTKKQNKSRFRVLANGTLQIDNMRPADRGTFSCSVSNKRKGETASGSVSINVLRKSNTLHFPQFHKNGFESSIYVGQLVLLTFATYYRMR